MTEPAQQRIVVGVKRSAASLAALRWAAAEARLRHVALHVVHAWEPAVRRASYAILDDSPPGGQALLASRWRTAWSGSGAAASSSTSEGPNGCSS